MQEGVLLYGYYVMPDPGDVLEYFLFHSVQRLVHGQCISECSFIALLSKYFAFMLKKMHIKACHNNIWLPQKCATISICSIDTINNNNNNNNNNSQ